jgi:hypothetical protein
MVSLALVGCGSDSGDTAVVVDPLEAYCPVDSEEVEARIDDILEALTLREKASLMHGTLILPVDGTWNSTAIPDKGVPGFRMLESVVETNALSGSRPRRHNIQYREIRHFS